MLLDYCLVANRDQLVLSLSVSWSKVFALNILLLITFISDTLNGTVAATLGVFLSLYVPYFPGKGICKPLVLFSVGSNNGDIDLGWKEILGHKETLLLNLQDAEHYLDLLEASPEKPARDNSYRKHCSFSVEVFLLSHLLLPPKNTVPSTKNKDEIISVLQI